MRTVRGCLPPIHVTRRMIQTALLMYAILVSLPSVFTAFFVQDHGKNSFDDLTSEHIGVGLLFAISSLLSNIPSAYLFPAKFYEKLAKLYHRKLSYTEMTSSGLAIMPAAFAAFLGRNLVHVGLSGAPREVGYLVLGPTILHTFCTRWYGTAALLDAGFETVSQSAQWIYDKNVRTLAQFQRDFAAQGRQSDIRTHDNDEHGIDLTKTAQTFYQRLSVEKATPHYGADTLLLCLRAVCVVYTVGLMPTFVHMVHKGLPWALDGIPWSLIGGMTHMAFYVRMAWDFIPQFMLYMTTLKNRSYSRFTILMILSVILLCTGLSGAGLMNVALHQVFDHVVKNSVLSPSAYARYWNFLIQPILGPLAAIGAGIFCNATGLVMLLLKYFYHQDKTTVDVLLEQVAQTPPASEEIVKIYYAQAIWKPSIWHSFSPFTNKHQNGHNDDSRLPLLAPSSQYRNPSYTGSS